MTSAVIGRETEALRDVIICSPFLVLLTNVELPNERELVVQV